MGVSYISISAVCTLLSFVGLQYYTDLSVHNLKSDGFSAPSPMESANTHNAIQLLFGSQATAVLLANFALNVYILLILCLKTIFFTQLYPSESQKLLERLVNYVIYKGIFLPLVVPPTVFQAGLWSSWLVILCTLKMFQALGRDRLERLNASPSATSWTYFRVYSVLLLVLFSDLLWIKFCLVIYRTLESPTFLLLFFEPLSIAFETLQALVVHGFQLLDACLQRTAGSSDCQFSKHFNLSAAGSLLEWKGDITRNLGFVLDLLTLLMALGHYLNIWWLHGMAFHVADVVLFLNIRALLSAILKRARGFIRLRNALGALHVALPDATNEEIQAYDDECAICREPMAKAKRLACNHLFHLACLRSWLDQSSSGNYSCPTCRKPLHLGRPGDGVNTGAADVSADEQLARQISSGLNQRNPTDLTVTAEVLPNQMQNPLDGSAWRGSGPNSSWLHSLSGPGLDGAGPSTGMSSVGIGRVQMMVRQLAAVGETYAQTALEDSAWSLWPTSSSQAGTSNTPVPPIRSTRYPGSGGGLHMRVGSRATNENLANVLAMAETVREVLPHIPEELIFEDLRRTNSVALTVNNLLQM